MVTKPPTRSKPAAKRTAKAPRRAVRKFAKPKLLSGGNPQIAKGDGEGPVRAYIDAMPDWKRRVGRKLDALVTRSVPGLRKAVKWNSPFYGVEGNGWFLSFHCFARYVKVTFFNGAALNPLPPGVSKHKRVRYLDVREDDLLNERQFVDWMKQASQAPGWSGGSSGAAKACDVMKGKSHSVKSSPSVSAKIASLPDWRGEMLAKLRAIVMGADPEIVEEVKWRKASNPAGVPVWSRDGMICTGETYKTAVKLTFAQGAALKDPSGLFNAGLGGGTRRAIDFHAGDTVNARALTALVREAGEIESGGREETHLTVAGTRRLVRPALDSRFRGNERRATRR